jgi:hypothetical protein
MAVLVRASADDGTHLQVVGCLFRYLTRDEVVVLDDVPIELQPTDAALL